jgi:hypothetical protein
MSGVITDLKIDAPRLTPPTADELRSWAAPQRVFVSSVMSLRSERAAVIDAIGATGAMPVAWELIVPAPVPPEEAWLGGVRSARILMAILSRDYGNRRPSGYSATHEEFLEAERLGIDRRIFVDSSAEGARDGHLERWLSEVRTLYSYATFASGPELAAGVTRALSDVAAYRLYTWVKVGNLIIRADGHTLEPPSPTSPGASGSLTIRGQIASSEIRAELAYLASRHDRVPIVVDGQLFEGSFSAFQETSKRGQAAFTAALALSPSRSSPGVLGTYSANGRTWTVAEQTEIRVREVLGMPAGPGPLSPLAPIDWRAAVSAAGGLPPLLAVVGELLATEAPSLTVHWQGPRPLRSVYSVRPAAWRCALREQARATTGSRHGSRWREQSRWHEHAQVLRLRGGRFRERELHLKRVEWEPDGLASSRATVQALGRGGRPDGVQAMAIHTEAPPNPA